MILSGRALRPTHLAVLGLALFLGGCLATDTEVKVNGFVRTEVMRRADVSPGGAAVSLASLDGVPGPVAARFTQALRTEAAAREIVFAEGKEARYLIRGYLSAAPAQGGATVSYVWDIFDARHRRAQRMEDALTVRATAGRDVWSSVDEAALTSIAARSADDLAAFLSNTPEAIAAASIPKPGSVPVQRRSAAAAPGALALARQ